MTFQPNILSDFPEALYPELLNSNDALTEHQVQGLSMLINVAEESISRLGLAASFLELNPRTLRAERIRREEFLDEQRRFMSTIPMRRVPNEIWEMIFLEYAKLMFSEETKPDDDHHDDHKCYSRRLLARQKMKDQKEAPLLHAPTVLVKVCSRWRALVLPMTNLWSLMRFDLPLNPRRVQTWLDRTGDRPLSLRIAFKKHAEQSPSNLCEDASFDLLFLESHRWEELDIDLGEFEERQAYRFLDHINDHVPSLQHLRMRKRISLPSIFFGIPQMQNYHFPRLTELTFRYRNIDDMMFLPSYRNLTFFRGTFWEVPSVSRVFGMIFGSMPQLLVLELSVKNSVQHNPSVNLQPVVHTNLTSFKLEWTAKRYVDPPCGARRYLDSALENVTFPSLTNVSLISGPGSGDPRSFSSFFARHSALETVHISLPNYEVRLDRSPHSPGSLKRLFSNTINVPHQFDTSPVTVQREISLPQGAEWGAVMEEVGEFHSQQSSSF
ncbi:hypothetical protein VKT23_017046 [Stygiomarasmius scandens]|uniref:F-box domain-containing protein n=1 Tax=Marasmiellus scandens TaxID=2682957 RepID=A0ABR1IW42_9AGAR